MPKKAKTLFIIDGHAHIYAAHYAPISGQAFTSASGEPTKATYIFTQAIFGLIERQKPDMLVVAMDSKTPPFRTEVYPQYKANRPPMPPDLPLQIQRIEQILAAMNIPVLRVDRFEADDVIGTVAKKAAADGYECYLCSRDKDLLQLIDDRICTFDIKTGTVTDSETMRREMGISPHQFIDSLALQGDASDNVPGVPDVGPKTALEWIGRYGSIENLYDHIDEIKGKRGENLRSFKDRVFLSRQLVTIDCNTPVENDYDAFALKEFNKARLVELFTELGFTRLLSRVSAAAKETAGQDSARQEVKPVKGTAVKPAGHDYHLINTKEKFEKFLADLKRQKLFAFDTETTSVKACSAELAGMSFSWQQHSGFYLPVKGPLGSKCLDVSYIRGKLAPIMADENVKKVGQNIKYDMIVMQNAGMPLAGVYFDTMVASYCLDPQRSYSLDSMAMDFLNYKCIPITDLIGKGRNQLTFDMVDLDAACEYAAEDADITFGLYEYLKAELGKEPGLEKMFEELEMPLVPVLAAMELNGVSIDTAVLRRMSVEISEMLEKLSEQIYAHAGSVFNIDSPKQLAEILFDKLNLQSLRTGKTGPSTDASVLEQLKGYHPIVDLILQYRTLGKLKNTYVDKLGSLINPKTNRLHTSFNQTVTATGRLSSSSPNLQNIPIRTELGRKIRSAFVPANKTYCILSVDYSQVELRLLAHFSKDRALTAAFAADRDIHRFVASQIYGVPLEDVTDEMRSRCKTVNFGIIYGQGAFGLSRSIGISRSEAKKFIDDYFARYSSIRAFMDSIIDSAKRTGYVETILNRRRQIADLKSPNSAKRSQAQRFAVNTVIQGSAADLIKAAMINIQRKIESEKLPVKLILQIHDELVFELPAEQAQEHARWISREMTGAIELSVPLKVDIKYGPTWLG